jgi:hypothetical protein
MTQDSCHSRAFVNNEINIRVIENAGSTFTA